MSQTIQYSYQRGDSRGDSARHGSRSKEINHSSLFNVGESVDFFGISGSRSHTSPPTSHNSFDQGRSSGFYSYGDNRSGHKSHTSQFYAYNHGGLKHLPHKISSRIIFKGCAWIQYRSKPSILLLYKHVSTPSSKNTTKSSSLHATSSLSNHPTTPSLFVSIFHFYSYICTLCSSTLSPYKIIRLSTCIIY